MVAAARRGLRAAGSVDSLSASTPEDDQWEGKRKRAGVGQAGSKRDPPRPERRNESPERQQTRRRRSKSFDVNGKRKPKIGASKNPVLESVSDNRLMRPSPTAATGVAGQPLLSSAGNPATPPAAKVKYPVSHHTGESQLQKLEIRGTPPSTVHQRNQEGRIGQTLHRRVRGPTEPTGSGHLLLVGQQGNYKKNSTSNTARHRASHDVTTTTTKHTDNRLKKTAP